jgi:hypothetical protein
VQEIYSSTLEGPDLALTATQYKVCTMTLSRDAPGAKRP